MSKRDFYEVLGVSKGADEREIKKALRKSLFKYKLHADEDLFEKAYSYIRQYY